MILRRVTQHVRDQNWTAIGIDLVIVVLGVFLGIQIGNWNEERKNEVLAVDYMERLQADLLDEIANWNYTSEYYEATRTHSLAALAGFEQSVEELDDQFLIDLYQASQVLNTSVRKGTYDELLATGRIVYITDDRTRRLLTNHYSRSEARTQTQNQQADYRQVLREQMDHRVQRAIREHCDDVYSVDENNFTIISLPDDCSFDLAQSLWQNDIRTLHESRIVKQALRFQLSTLDSRLSSMRSAIVTAENMLSELSKNNG